MWCVDGKKSNPIFHFVLFFLMIRRPPRSTQSRSSAASDVYKRQVFISNAENISKLYRLKEINQQLALNYSLCDTDKEQLVSEGRVFVLATLSMHSSEVGPTQAPVSYTHLRAHETVLELVCRLLLEKKKKKEK